MELDVQRLASDVATVVMEHRHWLHQHPELGFQEEKTSHFICDTLQRLGLEPQCNLGGFGIKVVFKGNQPGPTIAFRADFDALPIQEETGLPYASQHLGMMHACGHDVHTAMLLGAAHAISVLQGNFAGTFVLLFQPGEEVNPGGASLMVRDGALENPSVDAIFALHIDPLAKAGTLEFASGPVMAAPDELEIVVQGKGGHGAYPHLTIDPIPAAAEIVTALQQVVSRNVSPFEPVVVTIASIHGGKATNVIADTVVLAGTVRTVSPEARQAVPKWITRVAKGVAAAHGCEAKVTVSQGYPPVCNHHGMTELARHAARQILPSSQIVKMKPSMGGEDFSYYLEKVPGCIGRLGVAPETGELYPLHNARLRVDESALQTGVAFWLSMVKSAAESWSMYAD